MHSTFSPSCLPPPLRNPPCIGRTGRPPHAQAVIRNEQCGLQARRVELGIYPPDCAPGAKDFPDCRDERCYGIREAEGGTTSFERGDLAFARAGHRVVGVDLTEAYIAEARQRFEKEPRLRAELRVGDMRTWSRPGAFDLVANLYTSFGFFSDIDEDRACLRAFHRSLRSGGTLVMDLMSKEILARVFKARDWHRMDDGTVMLVERRITHDWTWNEVTWSYLRAGELQSVDFGHRIYSAAELRRELIDAGFSNVRIVGGFDGRPYDHDAARLVVIALA